MALCTFTCTFNIYEVFKGCTLHQYNTHTHCRLLTARHELISLLDALKSNKASVHHAKRVSFEEAIKFQFVSYYTL